MNNYIEAVKGAKVGDLEIFSIYPPSLLAIWPTFLNRVAATGCKENWEKYIKESNYMLTSQQYCNPAYSDYTEWIMEQKYVDQRDILIEMIELSHGTDQISKYEQYYKRDDDLFLQSVFCYDNLPVLIYILKKEKEDFLIDILSDSLVLKAVSCTNHIVSLIDKWPTRPLYSGALKDLVVYGDHSVNLRLERFVKRTPPQDTCPDLAVAMFGNLQQVKLKLVEKVELSFLYILTSRIALDDVLSDYLKEYMEKWNFVNDDLFLANLSSNILGSKRSCVDTEKIIRSLNERNIIFTKKTAVNLSSLSCESWQAFLNTLILFDAQLAFLNCKYLDYRLRLARFSDLSKDILVNLAISLPSKQLTNIYTMLGSSIAQWGFKNNVFFDFKEIKKNDVIWTGNIFMFALMLYKKELDGNPMEENDFICKYMVNECLPFLSFWYNSDDAQRSRFLYEDFGPHFCDTTTLSPYKINSSSSSSNNVSKLAILKENSQNVSRIAVSTKKLLAIKTEDNI